MEILRAYDNQTLELISSNTDFTFSESDLQNGEIKLSIFSEVGSFLDSTALDSGLNDFYVKDIGVKCVIEEPWITVAETCEFIIALMILSKGIGIKN